MTEPIHIAGLLADGWEHLAFERFHPGVDICGLVSGEPAVAVLRYAPGARVPHHRHGGLETIVVLSGVQSDEAGDYPAGTLILNPAGSSHSVWSERGCVVLIQWDRPVVFTDPL